MRQRGWIAVGLVVLAAAGWLALQLGRGEPQAPAGVIVQAEPGEPCGPKLPSASEPVTKLAPHGDAKASEPPAAPASASIDELFAARPFALLVLDTAGQPVAGAQVSVWESSAAAGMPPRPGDKGVRFAPGPGDPEKRATVQPPAASAVTDGAGRCELRLPTRRCVFAVLRPGEGARALSSGLCCADSLWASDENLVVVVLRPMGLVNGTVFLCDERPAPDADVRFFGLQRIQRLRRRQLH